MHTSSITLFTKCFSVHSYLSENIFTVAIKIEALLIKSHVVSIPIDRASYITLVVSALPLPVFTSAVKIQIWYRSNDIRLEQACIYLSFTALIPYVIHLPSVAVHLSGLSRLVGDAVVITRTGLWLDAASITIRYHSRWTQTARNTPCGHLEKR